MLLQKKNLDKAHYETNPLTDGSLENYRVIEVAMTSLTKEAVKDIEGFGQQKYRSL